MPQGKHVKSVVSHVSWQAVLFAGFSGFDSMKKKLIGSNRFAAFHGCLITGRLLFLLYEFWQRE